MMKQLKNWVSHNSIEVIYKLYVRPHLDYGDIVYDIQDLDKDCIFPSAVSIQFPKELKAFNTKLPKFSLAHGRAHQEKNYMII